MEFNGKIFPARKKTVYTKLTTHYYLFRGFYEDRIYQENRICALCFELATGYLNFENICKIIYNILDLKTDQTLGKQVNFVEKIYKRYERFFDFLEEPENRWEIPDLANLSKPLKPLGEDGSMEKPICAKIMITHKCDFKCTYCYNSSSNEIKNQMSTDLLLRFIDELADTTDCFSVSLTGGEPMSHPGFMQVLARIYERGMIADISTNGSYLTENNILKLVEIGQKRLLISIDTANPDRYHEMTGTHNMYDHVISGIKGAIESGIQVDCKCLVSPVNLGDVEELSEKLDSIGVIHQVYDLYRYDGRGRGLDGRFVLSYDQMQWMEQKIEELIPKMNKMTINFQSKNPGFAEKEEECPHCRYGDSGVFLYSDGHFIMCEKLAEDQRFNLGQYPETSILEAVHSPVLEKIFHPDPKLYDEVCKHCYMFNRCYGGCFANKILMGLDMYGIDPQCPKASCKNNILKLDGYICLKKHWVMTILGSSFMIIDNGGIYRNKLNKTSEVLALQLCDGSRTYREVLQIINSIYPKLEDRPDWDLLSNAVEFHRNPEAAKSPQLAIFDRVLMLNSEDIPWHDSHREKSIGTADFILTHMCNHQCTYCYEGDGQWKEDRMPVDTWLDIFEQFLGMGLRKLTITGGEAFLHPAFWPLLDRAHQEGVYVTLKTNGSLYTMADIQKMVELGLDDIYFSLPSANPELFNKITHSNGHLSKTLENLATFKKAGCYVRVKMVITNENASLENIKSLLLACENAGVDHVHLAPFVVTCQGTEKYVPSRKQMREIQKFCDTNYNTLLKHTTFGFTGEREYKWEGPEDIMCCSGVKDGLHVLPDGTVSLCDVLASKGYYRFGNLNQTKLKDIWHRSELDCIMKRDHFNDTCDACEYVKVCKSGCMLRSLIDSGKLWNQDPRCFKVAYDWVRKEQQEE